jgi:NTE family protein
VAEQPEPRRGLALSGGGHRAALFHIGVLARLADLDQLRQVRVISTVSGGSLVGTLYYLLLRDRLQTLTDQQLTAAVYRDVVSELERAYRQAVRKSFRGMALTNWRVVKLVFPTYSRTNLIAEVFERELYREVLDTTDRVPMSNLLVRPLDDAGDPIDGFEPLGSENDARDAPVPVLVINATTLNNGHRFSFEAAYVGEHAITLPREVDVDKNRRLARVRYSEIDDKDLVERFTVGFAVSASAAFPGGLAPLAVKDMYGTTDDRAREPYLVRLTDGGVRDNQGIDGLLDAGCTRLIVSDGSGQMQDIEEPSGSVPSVLLRVNSIEGKESREQRIYRVYVDHNLEIAFIHLQTGLQARTLRPYELKAGVTIPADQAAPFPTGLDRRWQRRVALFRTDLDSFSDLECSSLGETGYRACAAVMASDPFSTRVHTSPVPLSDAWLFATVRPQLESDSPDPGFVARLEVAKARFGKPFRLTWKLLPW